MSITKKARREALRERARQEMQGDLERVQRTKSILGSPLPKKSTTTTTTAATATAAAAAATTSTSASKVRSSPAVMKSPTTTTPSKSGSRRSSKKEELRERARLAMEEDKMKVEENLKSPTSTSTHGVYDDEHNPISTSASGRQYFRVPVQSLQVQPTTTKQQKQQSVATAAPIKVQKSKSSSSCFPIVMKTTLALLALCVVGVFMTSTHSFGDSYTPISSTKLLSDSQARGMYDDSSLVVFEKS